MPVEQKIKLVSIPSQSDFKEFSIFPNVKARAGECGACGSCACGSCHSGCGSQCRQCGGSNYTPRLRKPHR